MISRVVTKAMETAGQLPFLYQYIQRGFTTDITHIDTIHSPIHQLNRSSFHRLWLRKQSRLQNLTFRQDVRYKFTVEEGSTHSNNDQYHRETSLSKHIFLNHVMTTLIKYMSCFSIVQHLTTRDHW